MFRYEKLSAQEFDAIAQAHPDTFIPYEQAPEWSAFDQLQAGRDVQGTFAYYNDDNELMATAKINIWAKPMRKYLYIAQGPIWYVEPTAKLETEFVETVKKQFTEDKKTGALFLRLQLHHDIDGAVKPFEDVTYDRAMYVDISPDEEELMMSFSSTARRYIRKAEKNGVTVKEIPVDERMDYFKENLMDLMDETQTRNNFRAHPEQVYLNMMQAFPDAVKLFVAYIEERPVAWALTTEYRGHAQYPYAAGNEESRKKYAAYAVQWECMKDMKKRGNTVWDMTGIESERYPSLRNVTSFKQRFSKWEQQFPLVYDVPFTMAKYKALDIGLNSKRKVTKVSRETLSAGRDLKQDPKAALEKPLAKVKELLKRPASETSAK